MNTAEDKYYLPLQQMYALTVKFISH